MTDLLGHVFYLCLFIGQFLLTRKSTWGWVARFVGDLGWSVIGIHLGMTCIWSWGFLFLLSDIKGYLTWKQNDTTSTKVLPKTAA